MSPDRLAHLPPDAVPATRAKRPDASSSRDKQNHRPEAFGALFDKTLFFRFACMAQIDRRRQALPAIPGQATLDPQSSPKRTPACNERDRDLRFAISTCLAL